MITDNPLLDKSSSSRISSSRIGSISLEIPQLSSTTAAENDATFPGYVSRKSHRDLLLRHLCQSSMISNWEDAFAHHWDTYLSIDAVEISYPYLSKSLRYWMTPAKLRLSLFCYVLNVILFGCSFLDYPGSDCYTFSVKIANIYSVIYPLFLVFLHVAFSLVWKSSDVTSKHTTGSEKSHKNFNYQDIFSLKIHYLNNLNSQLSTPSPVSSVTVEEPWYKFFIPFMWLICAFIFFANFGYYFNFMQYPYGDNCRIIIAIQGFGIPYIITCFISTICGLWFFQMLLGKACVVSRQLLCSWIDRYRFG